VRTLAHAAGPVLTVPLTVTVKEDTTTNLSFMVTDSSSPIFSTTMAATSSATNLIDSSGLVFSGAGTNRVLAITPKTHKYGSATITVVATDAAGLKGTNRFLLSIPFVDVLPVFTTVISNKTVLQNSSATAFPFQISDYETAAASLTVTAFSGDTNLVMNSKLVPGGSGASRTLTVTPVTNTYGATTISVVVTDANNGKATNTFTLTVTHVNQAPYFPSLTPITGLEDVPFTSPFVVADIDTPLSNVTVTASITSTNLASVTVTNVDDTNRLLVITPQANAFNSTTIKLIASDGLKSTTNSVLLTLTGVNDPPSFTLSSNQVIAVEDAGRSAWRDS